MALPLDQLGGCPDTARGLWRVGGAKLDQTSVTPVANEARPHPRPYLHRICLAMTEIRRNVEHALDRRGMPTEPLRN
jgi:hypothetical protein